MGTSSSDPNDYLKVPNASSTSIPQGSITTHSNIVPGLTGYIYNDPNNPGTNNNNWVVQQHGTFTTADESVSECCGAKININGGKKYCSECNTLQEFNHQQVDWNQYNVLIQKQKNIQDLKNQQSIGNWHNITGSNGSI